MSGARLPGSAIMDEQQLTRPPAAPPAQAKFIGLLRDILIAPKAAFAAIKLSSAPPVPAMFALMLAAFALYYLHMRLAFMRALAPLAPLITITFGDLAPNAVPFQLMLLAALAAAAPFPLHSAARALGGRGGLKAGMAGFYLLAAAVTGTNVLLNLALFSADLFVYALLACALWLLVLGALHIGVFYDLSRAKSVLAGGLVLALVLALQWTCMLNVTMPYVKRARDLLKKSGGLPAALSPQYGDGQQNAAPLYAAAAEKLGGRGQDGEPAPAARAVLSGFSDPDGALAAMLERHREALEDFRRAAAVPYCNFAAAAMKERTPASAPPFPPGLIALETLTLLDARSCEAQGRTDLALDRLLAALSLADQLGQQTNFMLDAAALREAALDRLYPPTAALLAGRRLNETGSRLLLDRLKEAIAKTRFFGEALREQASILTAGAEPLLKELSSIFRKPAAERMMREYLALHNEMMETLSAAAAHNEPHRYAALMAALAAETADIPRLPGGKQALLECVCHPAKLAACYLPVRMSGFPDPGPVMARRYFGETKLTLLAAAAAIRTYEFGHGRPPAQLADLVPEYLYGPPMDPFAGAELRYVPKDDGAWAVYSVGPDRKDDNGALECQEREWNGKDALPGDLVFRSPAPEQKPAARAGKERARKAGAAKGAQP